MTKVAPLPPTDLKAITVLSEDEFKDRLIKLKPGTQFVYHRGLLMRDRHYSGILDAIANAAYTSYTGRKVHLGQRRIAPGVCEYFAEIRPRPLPRHMRERRAEV